MILANFTDIQKYMDYQNEVIDNQIIEEIPMEKVSDDKAAEEEEE